MSGPRKLKRFECVRVVKLLDDEVRSRTRPPRSRSRPCGDPDDIVALEAAIAILHANAKDNDLDD